MLCVSMGVSACCVSVLACGDGSECLQMIPLLRLSAQCSRINFLKVYPLFITVFLQC